MQCSKQAVVEYVVMFFHNKQLLPGLLVCLLLWHWEETYYLLGNVFMFQKLYIIRIHT